jgi:D-glycero-D-manno-heptose 1,7-bisphosphate phosphatase
MSALRPAVFLDKDGTLVEDVPFNVEPDRMRLTAGASEALAGLHGAGFVLVVVSNQSGVARGFFPEAALSPVWTRLRDLVAPVPLAGCYYCPHGPGDGCECRKPAPGMLKRAAADLGIDLTRSWLVGDILNDVEAGRRAGCRTVLIDNGNETEWVRGPGREPDHRVHDLSEAARVILAERG